ncbi:MAG TPA: hypothetical protein VI357_06875 [Mycobacteriales bacterium]
MLRKISATRIGLAGVVAGLLAVVGQVPAAADGATVVRFSLSAAATVPCALGGLGEEVLVEGTAHVVVFQSTDANGGTHFVLRANYDSLVGTGLTSGTTYHAVATEGTSTYDFDPFVGPPYLLTNTRQVRFVGQGPDNDFSIRETVHVTVNAQGEVSAEHSSFEINCS